MAIDSVWHRVTYRIDPRLEGPEPQDIAVKAYMSDHPDALRVAGAELARTDENGHWVDIWLDTEGPA
ncbi:hypothetical protein DEJ21_14095 [Curtobacterium sp. MCSS17_006]|uniref:hypothetical protein n=1 Tax=Curtobacterium sp. MCSS17_006 TaxID=2175642 RepID=UPI000DAA2D13|nr:hypothetical protein [Curtobacterium sp. MCSS17_006]PZE33976.1 hypothetical protein DEJ21_14095 [Curtobacterium sp. MCSS17_006]